MQQKMQQEEPSRILVEVTSLKCLVEESFCSVRSSVLSCLVVFACSWISCCLKASGSDAFIYILLALLCT